MIKEDIKILRALAQEKVHIANDPINIANKLLWQQTNDLHMTKPPVFINEICWHEMNVDHELTLQTTDPFAQKLEDELRKEIYCFRHIPGNMVVNDYIECPMVIHGGGFGISEDVDIVKTDETNDVVSRHFNIQIECMDDISKIKDPIISYDEEATMKNFVYMQEIFGDSIHVRIVGKKGIWFATWDNLIRLTGVEPAMYALIEDPEYVEALVERYVDASISLLHQYNKIGAWSSNNTNARVGSGGYGYTNDLPTSTGLETHAPTSALWGCGNAQIFSAVSEQMHWDFSLKYELKWLSQFGLNYYGCCEPLHNKMDIIQKIPNLRKISASPWSNIPAMKELAQNKYVLSCKPNPAIFCGNSFSEEAAREDIRKILSDSKDSNFEFILKDISTVNFKPKNLWKWNDIVLEEINCAYN